MTVPYRHPWGAPRGVRIPVTALKGRRPRPLDDGGSSPRERANGSSRRAQPDRSCSEGAVPFTTVNSMRVRTITIVFLVVFAGSCGSGDSFGRGSPGVVCPLLARLAASADLLGDVPAEDPESFQSTFDGAVLEYMTIVYDLLDVAPDELVDDLESVRAAVEQYRFEDGFEARAVLDEYIERECPRSIFSTTTTTPDSSTSLP